MSLVPVALHMALTGYDAHLVDAGKVTFTPIDGWRADPAANLDYAPRPIVVNVIDGDGQVTLMTTSDTAVEAALISYRVEIDLGAKVDESFPVTLPAAPPDGVLLELADRDVYGYIPLPGAVPVVPPVGGTDVWS